MSPLVRLIPCSYYCQKSCATFQNPIYPAPPFVNFLIKLTHLFSTVEDPKFGRSLFPYVVDFAQYFAVLGSFYDGEQ